MMKDDFVVENPSGQRWEAALQLLQEGGSFVFDDVCYFLDKNEKKLHCSVSMSPFAETKPSLEEAKAKIARAIEITDNLSKASKEFSNIRKQNEEVFSLIKDYGTGSTEFFRKVGDEVIEV